MPTHPRRSASAKGGTFSGGWSSATRPVRRAEDEIRARDTLVDANRTRSRTWVQFPPSPLSLEIRHFQRFRPCRAIALRLCGVVVRRNLRSRQCARIDGGLVDEPVEEVAVRA